MAPPKTGGFVPQWLLALASLHQVRQERFPLAAPTRAIGACGRAQRWNVALCVVDFIGAVGLQPDLFVFGATLSALERASEWPTACGLLAGLTGVNEVLMNSALSACEKGDEWAPSLLLLGQTRAIRCELESVVGNSAVISACAKNEFQWGRAFLILEKLSHQSLQPDVIAFNSALRACAYSDASHVERLLSLMRHHLVQADIVTSNTLINAFSRQLAWEESLAALRRGSCYYPFSAIAHNSALSSLGYDSSWLLSLPLLEELQVRRQADVVSRGAAMTALARASQSHLGLELLDALDEDQTNEQIYSAAISACESQSYWRESIALLRQAKDSRVRMDVTIYGSACNTCEKSSCWEHAIALLPDSRCDGISCSTPLANTAISSCAKSGTWLQAIHVLRALSRWMVKLDSTSCNAGVSACSRTWPVGLELLELSSRSRLALHLFGINAASTALANGGVWRAALLAQVAYGIEADVVGFNVGLEATSKCGEWMKSLAFLNDSKKNQLEVDDLGLGSFVTACSMVMQWELAIRSLPKTLTNTVEAPVVGYLLQALARRPAEALAIALGADVLERVRGSLREQLKQKGASRRVFAKELEATEVKGPEAVDVWEVCGVSSKVSMPWPEVIAPPRWPQKGQLLEVKS